MSSIELSDISKYYGRICAADRISFSVRPGSLTAILGPSGSGKTTLLALIAGIAMPTSGSILIAGRDVTYVPPAQRNVGLVFQSYALFPHLSVYENVAFPLRIRHLPAATITARVDETLERVRLGDLRWRRPAQLSGGQQQRVAIARAIAFEPSVLLLDEPLAALDRKLREEVRLELRHLQRELGITSVLVTHDQDEAMSMADEIVVLADGRVQQIDTPENAYRQPANRFVAGFLGIANVFAGALETNGSAAYIAVDTGDQIAVCGNAAASTRRRAEVCGILRPEQIALTDPTAPGTLQARIDELIFLGDAVRYSVISERGLAFIVQGRSHREAPRVGERVGIRWDARDVWILPDDPASVPSSLKATVKQELSP